jgi:hypothetical protein
MLLGNIGTNSAQAAGLSTKQKRILATNLQKSKNTLQWFHSKKHNWRLHKRYDKCTAVRLDLSTKRANICYRSRLAYRAHRGRMERLQSLLTPLPPHYNEWLCLHRWERGADGWATATGNGYYGGLQMDIDFQRTHGGNLLRTKGTANNWTMLEQMWAAEDAWNTRGFGPWPNTRKLCGI